jgi:hypothetical protein
MPSRCSYASAVSKGQHNTAKAKDADKATKYQAARDGYELIRES